MPLIASRILKLETDRGMVDVPIRLFAPEQQKDEAWTCRYEIDWPEGTQSMESGGADSMQALVIAMKMIGAVLYASPHHKSGRLMFDAPGNGYGFPVARPIRDLLEGDDAKFF